MKVFPHHKDGSTAISYSTQRNAVGDALDAAHVKTKKTHIGRLAGSRLAEDAGVPAPEIAKAGSWTATVLEKVYLQALSRPTIRGHAGFNPVGGQYFIARDIAVPVSLQRLVFPGLEEWSVAFLKSKKH